MKLTRPSAQAKEVPIGARYTGKYAGHVDTTTGNYWEALSPISGDALTLQQCLLAKPAVPRATFRDHLDAALKRPGLNPATGVMQ